MPDFSVYCDDFYINMNLMTEMDFPHSRESVSYYFQQLRKSFPQMENFHVRESGEFVLEEDKTKRNYRWATLESRRISSGVVNPVDSLDGLDLHRRVLDAAPYSLSVTPLDCESLNVTYGFDFTYRGNHNELIAEAMGLPPALESLADINGVRILGNEPSLHFAIDDECLTQCRISFETRTPLFAVKSDEFTEEQFSVYFTVRRHGGMIGESSFLTVFDQLCKTGDELVNNYVVENVLAPLHRTIAIK